MQNSDQKYIIDIFQYFRFMKFIYEPLLKFWISYSD